MSPAVPSMDRELDEVLGAVAEHHLHEQGCECPAAFKLAWALTAAGTRRHFATGDRLPQHRMRRLAGRLPWWYRHRSVAPLAALGVVVGLFGAVRAGLGPATAAAVGVSLAALLGLGARTALDVLQRRSRWQPDHVVLASQLPRHLALQAALLAFDNVICSRALALRRVDRAAAARFEAECCAELYAAAAAARRVEEEGVALRAMHSLGPLGAGSGECEGGPWGRGRAEAVRAMGAHIAALSDLIGWSPARGSLPAGN